MESDERSYQVMSTTLTRADLQESLAFDRREDVKAYFEAMSVEAANEELLAWAQEHHIKTFWHPVAFQGWRVAVAQAVATIFYRSKSIGPLTALSRRHGIEIPGLRGVYYSNQPLLKFECLAALGLAKTVNDVSLVTWKHIELCAFNGDTEAARQEGIRLRKKAERHDVDELSRRQTGMAFQENVESQLRGERQGGWEAALERFADLNIGKFVKVHEHIVSVEQTTSARLQDEQRERVQSDHTLNDKIGRVQNRVEELEHQVEHMETVVAGPIQEVMRNTVFDFIRNQMDMWGFEGLPPLNYKRQFKGYMRNHYTPLGQGEPFQVKKDGRIVYPDEVYNQEDLLEAFEALGGKQYLQQCVQGASLRVVPPLHYTPNTPKRSE